jgi:protein-disulfide isomerase-like protein with CxxC motif
VWWNGWVIHDEGDPMSEAFQAFLRRWRAVYRDTGQPPSLELTQAMLEHYGFRVLAAPGEELLEL